MEKYFQLFWQVKPHSRYNADCSCGAVMKGGILRIDGEKWGSFHGLVVMA